MTIHDFASMTIPQSFAAVAERYPRKPAVEYLGTNYSYRTINRLVDRFAAGLQKRGIEPGSKVVLYLPNSVQWVVAWLGVLRSGAVASPITPIYTPHDLGYVVGDTGASAVVCSDRNYGYVTRIMKDADLKLVVVSNMADMLPAFKRAFGWAFDKVPRGAVGKAAHTVMMTQLLKDAPPAPEQAPGNPDDLAEILYTGGTTKNPKGVPITHRLVLQCGHEQISISADQFPIEENVVLGSAPMFHILGQTTALGTVLIHGGTIVLQPRVNLDAMLDAVQRRRAKTLIGVPVLFRMILEHDRLDQYDLSSLQYCFSGGDVLPQEVGDRWLEKFGKPIYIGYGATETVGGTSMSPPGTPPGSMGKVLPSKTVLLFDPVHQKAVEPGEPGELLVHSHPMVEAYWNKPDETAKSFIDIDGKRYYRTADIVRQDENGYLYFVDRTMDVIKHKGYRVSASEVECVLQDHPAVIASCVIGVPDPEVGERIKAFVVLKKDVKGITGYDLMQFCRKQLTQYKIPQYIEFRDMLPKSKVGKLFEAGNTRGRSQPDQDLIGRRSFSDQTSLPIMGNRLKSVAEIENDDIFNKARTPNGGPW